MNFSEHTIVLQEVPNEVSLCFTITGCEIHCDGCHSPYLWKKGSGTELTDTIFDELVEKYSGLISCVLFMGGEWYKTELIHFLKRAKEKNLNTCLYTGLDSIDGDIIDELTYLKTGKWDKTLGGLDSKTTNQKFTNLITGKNYNHYFE